MARAVLPQMANHQPMGFLVGVAPLCRKNELFNQHGVIFYVFVLTGCLAKVFII